MKQIMGLSKGLLAFILVHATVVSAEGDLRTGMLQDLEFVQGVFETRYAPAEWKAQYASWNLADEVDKAKARVLAMETPSVKQYQKILSDLLATTQDSHVGVSFYSTERAGLPLQVKGVRTGDVTAYYFVYIDRTKLPEDQFDFQVGDQLVTFDGRPVDEVVQEIKVTLGEGNEGAGQGIAELYLMRRSAAAAMEVPRGPIIIGFKRAGSEQVEQRQLVWEYTPELIRNGTSSADPRNGVRLRTIAQPSLRSLKLLNREMVASSAQQLAPWSFYDAENTHRIGSRKTFLPALGRVLWRSTEKDSFDAYLYLTPERKIIGYVRIPSYVADEAEAVEFASIVARFEEGADALVIDQVNNPGGSVFYLYALVSMLTDRTMAAPRHKMTITQEDVMEALTLVTELKKVTNTEQAQEVLGKTLSGYPVNYQVAQFILEFGRFIIDEWNQGKTLTSPYFLYGADHINPHPVARFTKPIVLLINNLDFSGGDFFPAILQDNKRVTLLGTRTAGAGGYVGEVMYPNILGVLKFRLTGSLAERLDLNPIENLGVTPDISYALTAQDIQEGYAGYRQAINEAVMGALQP